VRAAPERESAIEARCVAYLRATGWKVYTLSGNSRAGGTRQSRGLCDVQAFCAGRALFWDVKTTRGQAQHYADLGRAPQAKWSKGRFTAWRRAHEQHAFMQSVAKSNAECGGRPTNLGLIGTGENLMELLDGFGYKRIGGFKG
jgi:hypothetical protein